MSTCIGAINILIDNEDSRNLLNCLVDSRAQLRGVTPQCAAAYLHKLYELKMKKSQSGLFVANLCNVFALSLIQCARCGEIYL